MKKLLTGLLMFSKAAVDAVTINKDNYNQYLCDESLFPKWLYSIGHYEDGRPEETTQPIEIGDDYRAYCAAKVSYERAVEDNAFNVMYTGHEGACLNSKVDTFGVLYAQTCEKLRQDKIEKPHAWIIAMGERERTPCTRPQR
jgi:hypothetical protein